VIGAVPEDPREDRPAETFADTRGAGAIFDADQGDVLISRQRRW